MDKSRLTRKKGVKVDKFLELLANRCRFSCTGPILSGTGPISGDMPQGLHSTDFLIILLRQSLEGVCGIQWYRETALPARVRPLPVRLTLSGWGPLGAPTTMAA